MMSVMLLMVPFLVIQSAQYSFPVMNLLVWGVHLEIPADEELARHDGGSRFFTGLEYRRLLLMTGRAC